MQKSSGSIGHSKHRKAFGTSPVPGHIKKQVERDLAEMKKLKKPGGNTYETVEELMKRRRIRYGL